MRKKKQFDFYQYHYPEIANAKHWTAFDDQRKRAEERGIYFRFEFEEWLAWWKENLGPNWFEMRGRKKGQYVMARYKDQASLNLDSRHEGGFIARIELPCAY